MGAAHLSAQVDNRVLHNAVGKPEHPQQHDHDADAREDEICVGADRAQQDAGTKQKRCQHGKTELACYQADLAQQSSM